ncbi:hypothetical protein CEXT_741901 [Caerostris extrusa]|uniref:F-box protein n=1 Tax=Caerostris extrusa TaxID=172846 RepID=A0AAV4VF39_CAEEX|nr:hypothetical protein CEXT_741901 [Caerostris extrusa]
MGIKFSISKGTSNENNITDGMSSIDLSKINHLLIEIFSFLPSKDLLRNSRLVCKEWRDIIDGHSVWKLKCERERKNIPAIAFEKIPDHYYRKIYLHDPYGKNLILNPHGELRFDEWTIDADGGDGFSVEDPPGGADPVPQEVGSKSCFATSYYPCIKHQVIDLFDQGVSKEVLQRKSTKIQIGEWHAARFDCASNYHLHVQLFDEAYKESEDLNHVCDFQYREPQWTGKEWHLFTRTFENVGNIRYVSFQDSGHDLQFWAGRYGSKMTGAFVKIIT